MNRIVKHTLYTLLALFVLLSGIAIYRAWVVITHLQKASDYEPFNLALTAAWSPHYPPLYRMFQDLNLDDAIHVSRPPAMERLIMSVPNMLVNFGLRRTTNIWHPNPPLDEPTTTTQSPSPPPETQESRPPTTTPSPPDMNIWEDATAEIHMQAEPDTATDDADFDPDAKWATVTAPAAPIYSTDGQRQDRILPGSVFEIRDQRTAQNGIVYVGDVHTPEGQFENIVIREQDLQLYRGKNLRETTRAERERASEKARIQGAITARKQEIETEHENQNPYQERYVTSLRRYQRLREEARFLRPIYEESSGTQRVNTGSRLREIRQELQTLTPSIRELQQRRDIWRENNEIGTAPDPEQDPQVMALRRELAALENNEND